jgi:hypothetical protein
MSAPEVVREAGVDSGPAWRRNSRGRSLRRFELGLGAAAVAAAVVSQGIVRLIHALGGYSLHAVTFTIEPASKWAGQVAGTWRGLLLLFGADYQGLPPGHDRDPARTYNFGPYTVMVWNRNLLPEIPGNPQ